MSELEELYDDVQRWGGGFLWSKFHVIDTDWPDVIQDAFVALLDNLASVHNPRAFLSAALRYIALNRLKRRMPEPLEAAFNLATSGPLPDRLAIERELAEIALANLAPQYREALEWAFFDGASDKECCQEMGVTARQFVNMKHRAKLKARHALRGAL